MGWINEPARPKLLCMDDGLLHRGWGGTASHGWVLKIPVRREEKTWEIHHHISFVIYLFVCQPCHGSFGLVVVGSCIGLHMGGKSR